MPSHTFTRVGLWQDSIDTNLISAAAARKDPGGAAEELHALDYQVYAYLQTAQDAAAARTLPLVAPLAVRIPNAGPGNAAPPSAGYYAVAAIPARYALERAAWAEAAALTPPQTPFGWADAVTHFARAIGAARSGNAPQRVRTSHGWWRCAMPWPPPRTRTGPSRWRSSGGGRGVGAARRRPLQPRP